MLRQPSPFRRLRAAFAVLLSAAALPAVADVPPRSDSGQTLVVPKAHLDAGEIYHIATGEDVQLACVSDAPLQRIAVTCRRIVGYFVVPFERGDNDAPILCGACRIPAASLTTGSREQDDLLRGPALLNAREHPEIICEITGARDVQPVSGAAEPKAYTLTLLTKLTIKGKTLEKEVPARIALLPFTWQTMNRYPGDLLTLRAALEFKLADFGLEKPDRTWNQRIADTLKFDLFLLANTVPPDKSLDPRIPRDVFKKHQKFMTFVRDLDQANEGYAFGQTYLQAIWDNAAALQLLASDLLTSDGVQQRDLNFALKAALRANELTESKDLQTLDTLARICHEKGDAAAAVRWQRQAVACLTDRTPPPAAAAVRETLERYQASEKRLAN